MHAAMHKLRVHIRGGHLVHTMHLLQQFSPVPAAAYGSLEQTQAANGAMNIEGQRGYQESQLPEALLSTGTVLLSHVPVKLIHHTPHWFMFYGFSSSNKEELLLLIHCVWILCDIEVQPFCS